MTVQSAHVNLRDNMSENGAGDKLSALMRRLFRVASLVAAAALGCAVVVPVISTQAYTAKIEPWEICSSATAALEAAAEHGLDPPNGEEVPAGAPVTLSVQSLGEPLIFSIASSPALLSTPDIDSGLGSLQSAASEYTFTSSKATTTPRTIYWDTSFTVTPEDCEAPRTFTTPVRSLVVVSSSASPPEEQAAADGEHGLEAPATGIVSSDGLTLDVRANHEAAVTLACAGTDVRRQAYAQKEGYDPSGQEGAPKDGDHRDRGLLSSCGRSGHNQDRPQPERAHASERRSRAPRRHLDDR